MSPPVDRTSSSSPKRTRDSMREDQAQVHRLLLRYGLVFLLAIGCLVAGLAAAIRWWLPTADLGISPEHLDRLLSLATFLQGICTLGITIAGVMVTLHIARSALGIAENSAKLVEREFALEAQRHANEIYSDIRAVQRQVKEALEHHAALSTQVFYVPMHWVAALQWRLHMLQQGAVWSGMPLLDEADIRQHLLTQLRNLCNVSGYCEADQQAHQHALQRLELQLAQRPLDVPLDLVEVIRSMDGQALWNQKRLCVAQGLRAWMHALSGIETKPWLFHLYRHAAKSNRSWEWMHTHCEALLAVFEGESDYDQSQALEVLMRAQVLWQTGYGMSFDFDVAQMPLMCLLAQQPGLAPAYQRSPDARAAMQAVFHVLKPLTYTQREVWEISNLMADATQPLPHPESMFAPAAPAITDAMPCLRSLWHNQKEAHLSAPHIFLHGTQDLPQSMGVEDCLALWCTLTQTQLQRQNVHTQANHSHAVADTAESPA